MNLFTKIFKKHRIIYSDDFPNVQSHLLSDIPFTKKDKLWHQICWFLYIKHEPLFYQEICRYYEN